MWIFTETGFVSAVRHYEQPGNLVVRARDKESLEGLAISGDTAIIATPFNDYPYRVHTSNEVFKEWLYESVVQLEYTDFKTRVYASRGSDFAHALTGVWETMHEVEDSEARLRRN